MIEKITSEEELLDLTRARKSVEGLEKLLQNFNEQETSLEIIYVYL